MVLIDDLDRCLPPAVMGTLEAIKLFLSAEKMVFDGLHDYDDTTTIVPGLAAEMRQGRAEMRPSTHTAPARRSRNTRDTRKINFFLASTFLAIFFTVGKIGME